MTSSFFANNDLSKVVKPAATPSSPPPSTSASATDIRKGGQIASMSNVSLTASTSKVSRVYTLTPAQQNQAALKKHSGGLAGYCQDIAKAHHVTVEASTSSVTKNITVIIGGKEKDVEQARRALWSKIAERVVGSVPVPVESLRFIIGPGGATLQGIHEACREFGSVHIELPPRDCPSYDGRVKIVAEQPEAIERAKQLIETIVKEHRARATCTLDMPAMIMPFLLLAAESDQEEKELEATGQGQGEQISSVSDQGQVFNWSFTSQAQALTRVLGVKVGIKGSPRDHDQNITLALSGDQETIDHARLTLIEMAARVTQALVTVTVQPAHPLPRQIINKVLLGVRNAVLHELQTETKTIISVIENNVERGSGSTVITIQGMPQHLPHALKMILDQVNSFVTRVWKCSEGHRQYLMHRHRGVLRSLEQEADVTLVSVPGQGFELQGRRAAVNQALTRLIPSQIQPLVDGVFTDLVPFPRGYLKHLIGKQGQFIAQLNQEHHVDIVIDDSDEEPTNISALIPCHVSNVWIIGDTAYVQDAKQVIQIMIQELDQRTGNVNIPNISPTLRFSVDPKHHLMLQGPQGRNLQHLDTKYGVRVVFPRDPLACSDVLVFGPDERARQAKDELLDLLHSELNRGKEQTIQVPTCSLPLVIGRGGVRINALRSEHDVSIDIVEDTPTEENGSSLATATAKIVIRGTEKGILAARTAIMNLVQGDSEAKDGKPSSSYHADKASSVESKSRSAPKKNNSINTTIPPSPSSPTLAAASVATTKQFSTRK